MGFVVTKTQKPTGGLQYPLPVSDSSLKRLSRFERSDVIRQELLIAQGFSEDSERGPVLTAEFNRRHHSGNMHKGLGSGSYERQCWGASIC